MNLDYCQGNMNVIEGGIIALLPGETGRGNPSRQAALVKLANILLRLKR